MNWILLFVILLMGGAGYFEYQNLQVQISTCQGQISEDKAKLDAADTASKAIEAENAQLKQSLASAKSKTDDLTKQLQTAQDEVAQSKKPAVGATGTTAPGTSPTTLANSTTIAAAFTTKLGTITTIDGKTFANCQLMKFQNTGMVVSCDSGITQIEYAVLPTALQKTFGYDPSQAQLSSDQLAMLEMKRQDAAVTGR